MSGIVGQAILNLTSSEIGSRATKHTNNGEANMVRMFTTDVGRFKTGDVRDFPQTTWKQISVSAEQKLETFSKELDKIADEYVVGKVAKINPQVQRRSIRT